MDVHEIHGEDGDQLELFVNALELPVGVALFDGSGGLVYSAQLETGELHVFPRLSLGADSVYYLEVTGLTMNAAGKYAYLAVRRPDVPFKTVWGVVYDATTRLPLPGSRVSVDLDDVVLNTVSDSRGEYELVIPTEGLPGYILLLAEQSGYVPEVGQVNTWTPQEQLDFYLTPVSPEEIVIPGTEEVIHLGDDNYSGSVNSQFQTHTIGHRISFEFDVPPELMEMDKVELSFFLKGAQNYGNEVRINTHPVAHPDESPANGSYGYYTFPIWHEVLVEGTNILVYESGLSEDGSDYDDFEFTLMTLTFSMAARHEVIMSWPVDIDLTGLAWVDGELFLGEFSPPRLYTFDPLDDALDAWSDADGAVLTGMDWERSTNGRDFLWLADNSGDVIRRYSPFVGSTVRTIPSPGPYPRDLSWDGQALWVTDHDTRRIYRIDPQTGSVLSSLPINLSNASGCELVGDRLWTTDRDLGRILILNSSSGAVLETITSGISDPYGLDYRDGYMWITDGENTTIYVMRAE